MSVILKYTGFLILIIAIIALAVILTFNGDEAVISKENTHSHAQQDDTSEQYRISFICDGDRNQIIDLIKGKAKFKLVYEGSQKFNAKLMNTDGSLLALLANENGPYRKEQVIDVPETGAYLLEVKTSGEWSLSRD